MNKSISVTFSNKEMIKINDIINFEQNQIDDIKAIAASYTKTQLRDIEEEGKDLSYLFYKEVK